MPKGPFWEWVNKTSEMDDYTFEPRGDNNIYLIPSYESAGSIQGSIDKYIEENFDEIFTNELEEWNLDPLTFPEISFELFKEWFEVHSHTMIYDTVRKPLRRM